MPKVSIVIPTYNVESYLRECLDSVVNQTLKDIEIICVNDGSTDNSLQIIQEYAAKDERIKVIDKPNSGYGHSMNVGIDNATGEYLGIVEPDDYIEWNMCETLYNKAKENNLDFVKGNYFKYSTTGNISNEIFSTFDKNNIYDKLIKPSEHKETFIGGASIWSAIYKLDMLKDNNIRFLETPGASFQDTSFWINVLFATQKAMFVKDAFYHYRIDNANSSVKSNSKIFCICDELHSLEKRYSAENDKMQIINALKLDKYTWNYNRLNLQGQEEFRPTYVKEVQPIFEKNLYEKKIVEGYAEKACKEILEEASKPKVSVIIPVYNAENYLKECIDSVINQTFKDLEIICVDDCSTDNSLKILKEYAVQDNRFKVIALEQNIKQGGARNRALDIAKGKYIMFVDSDDYLSLDTIDKFYTTIINNDCDIVLSATSSFTESKDPKAVELTKAMNLYSLSKTPSEGLKNMRGNNITDYRTGPVAKLYKKSIIDNYKIRFPEKTIQEDEVFHWQYFSVINSIYGLDGIYYHRRIHKDCTMYNLQYNLINVTDMVKNLSVIYDFLKKYELYDKNKSEYQKYFLDNYQRILTKCKKIEYITAHLHLKQIAKKINLKIKEPSVFQLLFSIKNAGIHKVINIFGIKLKIKSKKLQKKLENIENTPHNVHQLNIIRKEFTYQLCKYMPEEKYPEYLKDWFYKCTGEELNLDNPQTFNEKIQWMKLYDSTPLKTRLADKYLVRDWVKDKIGEEYLIPLLGVWENFEDIDFDKLPRQFVLKPNHGSYWKIICTNKNNLNLQSVKEDMNKWTHTNFAYCNGLELQYKNIHPKIICEKYIESQKNYLPDYRFFVFGGKIKYIQVDDGGPDNPHGRSFYDVDWNQQEFIYNPKDWHKHEKNVICPKNFDEMKEIATTLAQDFSFVRVDLYNVAGKIYFGEMTFTPCSGIMQWVPKQFNYALGQLIQLPNYK